MPRKYKKPQKPKKNTGKIHEFVSMRDRLDVTSI